MIGPILLALSWILLRLERKNLDVRGLNAPVARLREFGAGFLVAGLVVVAQQLGNAAVADVSWRLNPDADVGPGLLVPGNGAARIEVTGLPSLVLSLVLPLMLVVGVSAYLRRLVPSSKTV